MERVERLLLTIYCTQKNRSINNCIFYCLNLAHKKIGIEFTIGKYEQREQNPELNLKNFDPHERRLEQFSKSKYKNQIFYIGADGTCYYYPSTGRKIFSNL